MFLKKDIEKLFLEIKMPLLTAIGFGLVGIMIILINYRIDKLKNETKIQNNKNSN